MNARFSGGYIYCLTIMSEKYDYKCYIGQHHTKEYGIVDTYWGSGTQWVKVREECERQNIVITKDILCFCETKAEMDRMERYWISQFDSTNPEYGFNATAGGGGTVGLIGEKSFWFGKHPSAETRRKLSDANKGKKNPWFGKHPSDESRKKMSDAHKGDKHPMFGKHLSAETKRKLSDARKGEKNHNFGKHFSVETKRKMSDAHKGEKNHNFGKHFTLSAETRRKMSDAQKGEKNPFFNKQHTAETKRKISYAHKGKQLSDETKKKMSDAHKGKQLSAETRRKMSDAQKGEKNPMFGKHPSFEMRKKISESQTKYEIIVYKDNIEITRLRGGAAIDNFFDNKNAHSIVYKCCNGKAKSYRDYTFQKVEMLPQ